MKLPFLDGNTPMLAVLLLLSLLCLAANVRAQDAPDAVVRINASKPDKAPIPRTLFGTFLEPLGPIVYGGLWAQILENPGFEPNLWSAGHIARMLERSPHLRRSSEIGLPLPWQALDDSQGWRYQQRFGGAVNGSASLYIMALPGRQTGVRQEVFLPIHRTRTYTGSFSAKVVEGDRQVEISIRKRNEPGEVYARTTLDLKSKDWKKYEFTLEVREGAVAPLEPVDFVLCLRDGGRAMFDQLFLFPSDHMDGLDPEIVALTRDMNSTLIRYGGNFTSAYHWKDGVGPMDKRPPTLNQAWGMQEWNHLGTDEFLRFCELTRSRPQICVNLGTGTPQEAAEWVRYVNSKWDRKRGDVLWELGNELWGTDFQIGYPTRDQELAPRTKATSDAIRKVDPKAVLIATGGDPEWFPDWNAVQLSLPPGTFQYLSTHFVVNPTSVRKEGASNEHVAEATLAMPLGLERRLVEAKKQIDNQPGWKGKAAIAFTEWLFISSPERSPALQNMGAGVVVGAMMNSLLRVHDACPIFNMTSGGDFHGIGKRRGRVYASPSYWAFRMYSSADIDRVVPVATQCEMYSVTEGNHRLPDIPDVPYLDVAAAVNKSGDTLTVFVVNRHLTKDIAARIDTGGYKGAARITRLKADSLYASNNEERPDAITPQEDALSGPVDTMTFPPASVTRIAIRKR